MPIDTLGRLGNVEDSLQPVAKMTRALKLKRSSAPKCKAVQRVKEGFGFWACRRDMVESLLNGPLPSAGLHRPNSEIVHQGKGEPRSRK